MLDLDYIKDNCILNAEFIYNSNKVELIISNINKDDFKEDITIIDDSEEKVTDLKKDSIDENNKKLSDVASDFITKYLNPYLDESIRIRRIIQDSKLSLRMFLTKDQLLYLLLNLDIRSNNINKQKDKIICKMNTKESEFYLENKSLITNVLYTTRFSLLSEIDNNNRIKVFIENYANYDNKCDHRFYVINAVNFINKLFDICVECNYENIEDDEYPYVILNISQLLYLLEIIACFFKSCDIENKCYSDVDYISFKHTEVFYYLNLIDEVRSQMDTLSNLIDEKDSTNVIPIFKLDDMKKFLSSTRIVLIDDDKNEPEPYICLERKLNYAWYTYDVSDPVIFIDKYFAFMYEDKEKKLVSSYHTYNLLEKSPVAIIRTKNKIINFCNYLLTYIENNKEDLDLIDNCDSVITNNIIEFKNKLNNIIDRLNQK